MTIIEASELLPGYYVDPWRGTGAWCSIPWPRDPDEKAELIDSSLGPEVINWAEGRTYVPGLVHYLSGASWRFTDGQKRFLILWYALSPEGRWCYRSGVKRASKGGGKDPLGAAMSIIELIGPSHFVGWENDRPVGVTHRMPLVQIAANSEAQAKDVLRVANALIPRETREYFGIDCGETRTIVDGGGRLELLTASEKSSEGDPATFIMLNEALALDTPLPTPTGWTTMGDVQLGDELVGRDGLPVRVLAATEVQHGRRCYRVKFADGTSVVASDGHLWLTALSMSLETGVVRTTQEIVDAPRKCRVPRLKVGTVQEEWLLISSLEEIKSVPVRCLKVDAEDHLFLAGQGWVATHNSHHMTEMSGGHRLAQVARRNVGKSPAELQARVCEFTNAHQQGMDSVAERSYVAWQAQVSGKTKRQDILYDSIEAPPDTNLYDDASRMHGLRAAYMDAPWADIERLSDEVLDPRTPVADSIRYYLNGLAAAEDAWVDPRIFDELAHPDIVVADREQIALFLDCSKSEDATGLMASRISDGHVFTLGCWQRPHGERGKGWLVPREQVDAAVRGAADRYQVVWFGADPSPARDDEHESLYWMEMLDRLHRDLRDELPLWATPGATAGHSVVFDMRLSQRGGVERNRLFTEAAMQTAKDIDEDKTLTHDGDAALRMHVHNAKRRPNQWGVSLGKVTRDSKKLVDLAVCMVGARMGRRIALNSGKLAKKRSGVVW